jgi:LuxR family maltose regulon positive regulatory protein
MSDFILLTKTIPPPPRPNVVTRERLLTRLNCGLHPGLRLTVVSAPAGFGKTTLIRSWLDRIDCSTAWLSLDEGDNDLVLFMRYLIVSLRQVVPDFGGAVLQSLNAPQMSLNASLTQLVNEIGCLDRRIVLVLDDYHAITERDIHAIPRFLIDHAPPTLHVVIVTREDPPLPMPGYRARGQMIEIRQHDLRFTPDEVADFLQETMGLHLPVEAIHALEARTEGWIAGLQMAALALQRRGEQDVETFIAAFAGSDRYVVDYLISEVVERQPEPVREFLRHTAILDRLTAPLCDALTGRSDGQQMLEHLESANLFVVPLDHSRTWYRYHRLFAEMMRLTLPADEREQLHQDAAAWYAANDHDELAIHHALILGEMTGDYTAAETLMERTAGRMLQRGNVQTVFNWLGRLPNQRVTANLLLTMYQAWALAFIGRMTEAAEQADAIGDDAPDLAVGLARLLSGFVALLDQRDAEAATQLTHDALARLPEEQMQWRVLGLWLLAEAIERTRPLDEAADAFRRAYEAGKTLDQPVATTTVELSLALTLNNLGRRGEAIALCEEALERYAGAGGHYAPVAGLIFSRLGMLHYEGNRLDAAQEAHRLAEETGRTLGVAANMAIAQGLAAPTRYAVGEMDEALIALDKAAEMAGQTGYGDAGWYRTWAAWLRLRHGDIDGARAWAAEEGLTPDIESDYMNVEAVLTYVRLLMAERRLAEAGAVLDRLAAFVEARFMRRHRLTVLILQALCAARKGEPDKAEYLLHDALRIAAPEGYVRAFLDEDPQVIALAERLQSAAPSFVNRLLEQAGVPISQSLLADQPLIEPLSERELEVLQLIADGLSNRDIADRLFIAVGTVKTHINNIYGKLEVGSRTEAVAKARALHLLA